jgi:hypothetical protein
MCDVLICGARTPGYDSDDRAILRSDWPTNAREGF